MKKILFVAAAALVSTGAFAQNFEKGDVFINGSISELDLGIFSNDGDNTTQIEGSVGGGYFFTDKFAADVELGGSFSKFEKEDAEKEFNFEIGARYYVWDNIYARLAYRGEKPSGSDMASWGVIEAGYNWFLISDAVYFAPALYFKKGFTKDINKETNAFGIKVTGGVRF